jgi:hypothetical protein
MLQSFTQIQCQYQKSISNQSKELKIFYKISNKLHRKISPPGGVGGGLYFKENKKIIFLQFLKSVFQ